jgi:hypothetical protein
MKRAPPSRRCGLFYRWIPPLPPLSRTFPVDFLVARTISVHPVISRADTTCLSLRTVDEILLKASMPSYNSRDTAPLNRRGTNDGGPGLSKTSPYRNQKLSACLAIRLAEQLQRGTK